MLSQEESEESMFRRKECTVRPGAAETLRKVMPRNRPLDSAAGSSQMTLASAFSGTVGVKDPSKLQRGRPW